MSMIEHAGAMAISAGARYGSKGGKKAGHLIGKAIGRTFGGKKGGKQGYKIAGGIGSTLGYLGGAIGTAAVIASLKKGGPIKKTGTYRLHKGEYVIPKKPTKTQRKTILRRIRK
jgi:hypothetical protein